MPAAKTSTKKTTSSKPTDINFEKALAELEDLVVQLEAGDLSLEASLAQFERGVQLTKTCQQALATAEQKVQILLQQDGKDVLSDFAPLAHSADAD